MSAPERICIFYTVPEHYDTILKEIRRQNPTSHITAVVPTAYVDASLIAPFVDEAVRSRYDRYPAYMPWRTLDLVRSLRKSRSDLFIVIFASMKLRILASMCGAKASYCWSLHGRVAPLETNLLRVALGLAWLLPAAWWRTFRVWSTVHLRRVRRRSG